MNIELHVVVSRNKSLMIILFLIVAKKDSKLVQQLIEYENSEGKNIFCDWISDADYLKRNLVCDATLKVIEWRLQQSDAIIYVKTKNSDNSVWCMYELNYFHDMEKPIYVITEEDIRNRKFDIAKYDEKNFRNTNYKELVLIEKKGCEILGNYIK